MFPERRESNPGGCGWKENGKDLRSSYLDRMGWTQVLCCLKTFVEIGVNLRELFYRARVA
jgi:hypothetical protein